MLAEEAGRRTASGKAATTESGPLASIQDGHDAVLIAQRAEVSQLLPAELTAPWQHALQRISPTEHPEGFSIVALPWRAAHVLVIAGNDVRGELFGAGWLLRNMIFTGAYPRLPHNVALFQAPEKAVRGHQIGYRFKNNSYDAWTLAQFEQGIRDLAIFGTNTIQLISPVSDDAPSSPLFPAPALETFLGISKILAKYGLDCDLYYPEIAKDYTNPAAVEAELRHFTSLVSAMSRLDALYIPGGDPGHTPPDVLFRLVAREVEVLHRYHPSAAVWISAQGFDQTSYDRFYALLDRHPAWLTGVFFGPQSRDSFFTQRARIPARYSMQFYPDIAHTMHAQFPVPQWDPVFALTEGREPICPRPEAFGSIYRHFASLHNGFVTYSEGVNDDVNKILWSQLGWSSKTCLDTILAEYARMFLHREGSQQAMAVQAIHGLEENWRGPIPANRQIPVTLRLLQQLERDATPMQVDRNGPWESLLYRGIYDDYVQRKLARERTAQANALVKLGLADLPSGDRVAAAKRALDASVPTATETTEHDRLFTLAGQLFRDWGLQLSVRLYGASNWERGANLDRVDTPLSETAWLSKTMVAALLQPTEAARVNALDSAAHWQHPSRDAIYDDLGDPANEPHLVRGAGWANDPEMYATAIDGIADRTLADGWRLSWLDYAETLYEVPLELAYSGLDPRRSYRVRVTYAGEDYALPLRLTANGTEVHAARLRASNPETLEFPVDLHATADGSLRLRWSGPRASGGSGRGRQVAEVWLIPNE
jgi:hypothetical protein